MMLQCWPILMGIWLSILSLTHAQDSFQQQCLAFDPVHLIKNSTLRVLAHVPANTTINLPGNDPSCGRANQIVPVEVCRVALTIPTSNRSSIIFEQWFPPQDVWQQKRRFLGTGNGGIDGCIKYEDLSYGVQHGFTTTGSNNGHNGTGGADFLNNPDIIEDFSYRSLHTTAVAGKTLSKAFYGEAHEKSYYIGCSGGGRQGVQAAYLYPEDYDGILAGAPAADFNAMSSWRAHFYPLTGAADSPDFIKKETWAGLIHDEVLRQCDNLDGVKDGIITDPSECQVDPSTLLCASAGGSKSGECLSVKQVDVVRQVFSPLRYDNGTLIYPSLQPGAEAGATARLLSGTPFPYSEDWFKYVVYSNPKWDPATWSTKDAEAAETLNAQNSKSWPDSLAKFKDRKARLVLYHGGQDIQISGFNTERLYHHLSDGMKESSEQFDEWFRFFRIPGMGHCGSGPGAWQFGQTGAAGVKFESKVNVLAALLDWVENGAAPAEVEGVKFVNDTVALGVEKRRKHCRFPMKSTYVGGDANSIDSWICK